ncbi:MAG: nitroreductase family protein [Christensenellales bacterium]|jgi:predicted oxidoreductase (fatty acid repression mutant protein)
MSSDFYEILKTRRSNYTIGKTETVPIDTIEETIITAMTHAPSAFNHQPARVVALFREHHQKLWDIVWEVLKETAPPENLAQTKEKLDDFAAGYGTLLFLIDEDAVRQMQERFPLYADNFPTWAEQSTGMLQYVLWAALDAQGLGVNLQHYNPLIDSRVHAQWDIPQNHRLISQMVLGSREAPPEEKELIDPWQRVRLFK